MKRRNSTDRTGRSKKWPRHVRLYHWLMATAAWKSLNGNQRAIYLDMAARYDGKNNGTIPYAVRDAADGLHVSKATAARDLAVLRERGFIVPVTKGAFSLKQRLATTWRLTEFNCDVTHDLPTKDFARWSPEIQNTVSPQTRTVPVVKPNGTCSETVTPKPSPDGTCSGTVAPILAAPRSHHRYTSKLPGGVPADAAPPIARDCAGDDRATRLKIARATFATLGIDTARLADDTLLRGAELARRISQCERVPGSNKRRPAAIAAWETFVKEHLSGGQ